MSEKPPPYSIDPRGPNYNTAQQYSSFGGPPPPAYSTTGPVGGGGAPLGWGYAGTPSATAQGGPGLTSHQHGSVHVVSQQPATVVQPVIVQGIGTCPSCRQGILRHQFTCPGIFLCCFFFPIGIVCLFALMERRCSHCYTSFG